MNFDQTFDRLVSNEGGYSNNPADPGGETNWGITWTVLREAIGAGIVPSGTTIKNLTRNQAKDIYRWRFWGQGKMDSFDGAISFQTFDAAVNHGIETAIRLLQRAAGVADDGNIGPITVAAIKSKSVTDMLMLFIAYRIRYWTKLSTWLTFGKGWANRAADDLVYAAEDS